MTDRLGFLWSVLTLVVSLHFAFAVFEPYPRLAVRITLAAVVIAVGVNSMYTWFENHRAAYEDHCDQADES